MSETDLKRKGKVMRFHQFIQTHKGPVNTAIVDLLKEQVFQVENSIIEAFEQHRYEKIGEFLATGKQEELIIEVDSHDWIPPCGEIPERLNLDFKEKVLDIELHLEEGGFFDEVIKKIENHNVFKVVIYEGDVPKSSHNLEIERRKKDFGQCTQRTQMNGEMEAINEFIYRFNKENNSCWGGKFAVTRDGMVRPCIYSQIIVGDIRSEEGEDILQKLQEYWYLTKDKVEKCKECELKYVCFDCREIPYRERGNLNSTNPNCKYDPRTGTWSD